MTSPISYAIIKPCVARMEATPLNLISRAIPEQRREQQDLPAIFLGLFLKKLDGRAPLRDLIAGLIFGTRLLTMR